MSGEDDRSRNGVFGVIRDWLNSQFANLVARSTPKCTDVVRLLSQSMDTKLPLMTRIRLRLHFVICGLCKRYGKQLEALRKFASSFPEHAEDSSSEKLSDSAKARIRRMLRSERRK